MSVRRAVLLRKLGGPDVLRNALETVPKLSVGRGQIGVEVSTVGVNFHDTYIRTGLYPADLPVTMGAEAAGVISELGDGVDDSFKIGDRVCFFQHNSAYTSHAVVNATSCFRHNVSDQEAAAITVQGMTAHYLACDTFPLAAGHTALVHAAAGGTGALLVQMAKLKGATVIGTVSSESKAEEAKAAGCDTVIVYGSDGYDFLDKTRAACPEGVDVVYDSIGAATAESSLQTLKPRGTCVFFGNSSGAPKPIAPTPTLAKLGSLYITRPLLEHYMRTPEERRRRAEETFGWVADGKVKVRIAKEFDGLGEAAAAHEFLESRQAKGKVLMRV